MCIKCAKNNVVMLNIIKTGTLARRKEAVKKIQNAVYRRKTAYPQKRNTNLETTVMTLKIN